MTIAENDDWPRRVAILGVGLLGGSVALSLRQARPTVRCVGHARNAEKRDKLVKRGIVDEAYDSVAEASQNCDVIVVAAPVDQIGPMAIQAAEASPSECLITDVGSTKRGIVETITQNRQAAEKFVAAHPIAGSEKSGADHARADLFREKVIVLTPTDDTSPARLSEAERFWRLTGGRLLQMSPVEHDAHLAAVSHVPHLVSALVAKMADPEAIALVGSGWRDITRVAAGDPALWTAICGENRTAITREIDRFLGEFDRLRQIVDSADDRSLEAWLTEAKRVKEQSHRPGP